MRALVAAVALLLPALACAQSYTGSVTINSRAIPLPPGEWQVIGASETPAGGGSLGLNTLLLAQEQGSRLSGLVSIAAGGRSQTARYQDWVVNGCEPRPQPIAVIVREGDATFQNCAQVSNWRSTIDPPVNPGPRWAGYFRMAQTRPEWAPSIFHVSWSRIADHTGALDVIYAFSPETRGFAPDTRDWPQNAWNPANQAQPRRAYLARLVAWARENHQRVRRGFAKGAIEEAPAF